MYKYDSFNFKLVPKTETSKSKVLGFSMADRKIRKMVDKIDRRIQRFECEGGDTEFK